MQTGTMRLRELTVRYSVRKDGDGQPVVVGRDLSNPRDTAASLMTMLQDEPSEVFAILCITTKHRVSRGQPRHARCDVGASALMFCPT